jgi:hypothetical protein
MPADDRFTLEVPPSSPRARVVAAIRAEHAERDRRARTDEAFETLRATAWIAVAGERLLTVEDEATDGVTLSDVIECLNRRWKGDYAVFRGGRAVALVRTAQGGRRVVEVYE